MNDAKNSTIRKKDGVEGFFCKPVKLESLAQKQQGILTECRLKISHLSDDEPLQSIHELVGKRVISPWYSGFKVGGIVFHVDADKSEAMVVWGQRQDSISSVKLPDLKQLNPLLMQNINL